MSISFFTTWATGTLNGYTKQEGGIPASIKYGVMGLTTGLHTMRMWGHLLQEKPVIRGAFVGLMVAAPIIVGAVFCLGGYLGKAVRHVEDRAYPPLVSVPNSLK